MIALLVCAKYQRYLTFIEIKTVELEEITPLNFQCQTDWLGNQTAVTEWEVHLISLVFS